MAGFEEYHELLNPVELLNEAHIRKLATATVLRNARKLLLERQIRSFQLGNNPDYVALAGTVLPRVESEDAFRVLVNISHDGNVTGTCSCGAVSSTSTKARQMIPKCTHFASIMVLGICLRNHTTEPPEWAYSGLYGEPNEPIDSKDPQYIEDWTNLLAVCLQEVAARSNKGGPKARGAKNVVESEVSLDEHQQDLEAPLDGSVAVDAINQRIVVQQNDNNDDNNQLNNVQHNGEEQVNNHATTIPADPPVRKRGRPPHKEGFPVAPITPDSRKKKEKQHMSRQNKETLLKAVVSSLPALEIPRWILSHFSDELISKLLGPVDKLIPKIAKNLSNEEFVAFEVGIQEEIPTIMNTTAELIAMEAQASAATGQAPPEHYLDLDEQA